MDVRFQCPHCGVSIEADASLGGGTANCPECEEAVQVPHAKLEEGTVIGGFRLERKLGSGAMGQVFLATQLSMGREVALKILPLSMTSTSEYVDRFQHEVRLLARLDHPNVVRAFEAGEDSGFHYLAMSYVSGRTLEELLEEQGPFNEEDTLAIAVEVARALDYTWQHHQILHRDIKPANLMLNEEGEILLMDMGISKCVSDQANMTLTGMVVGTPYYMSPEQATGGRDLDCRADIYALGVTLFHLAAGELPFGGNSAMEVLSKMMLEEPPSLCDVNPELSEGFSLVVRRMMARDREERHGGYAELIDDLLSVAAGKDTSPATRRFSALSSGRRRWRWLAPLAAGVAAVAITVAIVVALARDSSSPSPVEPSPSTTAMASPQPAQPAHTAPTPAAVSEPAAADDDQSGIAGMYEYAFSFTVSNPDQTEEAIRKFKAVQDAAAGTAYADKASAMIALLEGRRAGASQPDAPAPEAAPSTSAAAPEAVPETVPEAPVVDPNAATARLDGDPEHTRREVMVLALDGKYDLAVAKLKQLRDSLDPGQDRERRRLDRLLDNLQRRAQGLPALPVPMGRGGGLGPMDLPPPAETTAPSTPSTPEAPPDPVEQLAVAILRGDLGKASALLADPANEPRTSAQKLAVAEAREVVDTLTHYSQRLLSAYTVYTGTKHTFQLTDGPKELLVQQVATTGITGKEEITTKHGTASFKRSIELSELTLADRLATLANLKLSPTALALVRALVARQQGAHELATQYFAAAKGPLGEKLRELGSFDPATFSEAQKRELRSFLSLADLPLTETNPATIARWLAAMPYSAGRIGSLREAAKPFSGNAGYTALAFYYQPVLEALTRLKPWDSSRLDDALSRLARDNPGFDVRQRTDLRSTDTTQVLFIKGTTKLRDLRALRGLPITHLRFDQSGVEDLTPLAGMPLHMLGMNFTPVSDLTPLAGMPLERLELEKTSVRELAPLLQCPHLNMLIVPAAPRDLNVLHQLGELERIGYSWNTLTRTADEFWRATGNR